MRRAAKVDANQAEIKSALEAVGCSVQSLHQVGGGVPDLLVARFGVNYLIEVKNPDGRNRVEATQSDWIRDWRAPVLVVENVGQALAAVGVDDRTVSIPFRGIIT